MPYQTRGIDKEVKIASRDILDVALNVEEGRILRG